MEAIIELSTKVSQCLTYEECMNNVKDAAKDRLFPNRLSSDHDVLYVAEALERSYYVS